MVGRHWMFHPVRLLIQEREGQEGQPFINPTCTMMKMVKVVTNIVQIGMCRQILISQQRIYTYVAWTAWLLGYPLNRSKKGSGEVYLAPVRPLHLLRHGQLPVKAKKKFDNAWRPILELMHNEVASSISNTSVEKMHDSYHLVWAKKCR